LHCSSSSLALVLVLGGRPAMLSIWLEILVCLLPLPFSTFTTPIRFQYHHTTPSPSPRHHSSFKQTSTNSLPPGPRLMSFFLGYGHEVWAAGNYYFWIPMIAPFFGCTFGGWLYDMFIFTGESIPNGSLSSLRFFLLG